MSLPKYQVHDETSQVSRTLYHVFFLHSTCYDFQISVLNIVP